MYIETRSDWDRQLKLCSDDPCIQELYIWKQNARNLNNKKLQANNNLPEVVYSDSSNVATAAYMVQVKDSRIHKKLVTCLRTRSKVLPSEKLKEFRWY